MTLTFLGTGTSDGVPQPACACAVCSSANPKNRRLRCGAYLRDGSASILLDAPFDLRQQALRENIREFDAILLTHAHIDHVGGLAELRAFNRAMNDRPIDIYADAACLADVKKRFDYFFCPPELGGGVPIVRLHEARGPFTVKTFHITPLPIVHGSLNILGYRIGSLAYITDASFISEDTFALLRDVDTLVLNALRYRPHSTHFNVDQAVAAARRIGARETYFIHFTHDIEHDTLSKELPAGMAAAYDGLTLTGV